MILLAIVLSVHLYRLHREDLRVKQEKKFADIAAQIWVASATYRNNPDRFKMFRDSLLGRKRDFG